MTPRTDNSALMVQLPTKLAVLSEEEGQFSVVASVRTGVGGVVVPYFSHDFAEMTEAAESFRGLVDGWAGLFPAQEIGEDSDVLPAAVGQTPDGETLTLVYFGDNRWICFDSLDPDGIYADWEKFDPALNELIDVVFNPA